MTFRERFAQRPPILGLLHLPPLPGSSGDSGAFDALVERACHDASVFAAAGCDAVLLENASDGPFTTDTVPPATVAALTLIARAVLAEVPVPLGLSVLRNDAATAVSIAALTGAHLVRINLHTGLQVAAEGVLEGHAAETLRLRSLLGTDVLVLADLRPRYATLRSEVDLARAAHDAYYHGLADALILGGRRDRLAPRAEELAEVRAAVPDAPLLLATGLGDRTLALTLDSVDGAILAGDPRVALDPAAVARALAGVRG